MRFMEWSSPKHNVKKIDGVEVECGVEFVEWSLFFLEWSAPKQALNLN